MVHTWFWEIRYFVEDWTIWFVRWTLWLLMHITRPLWWVLKAVLLRIWSIASLMLGAWMGWHYGLTWYRALHITSFFYLALAVCWNAYERPAHQMLQNIGAMLMKAAMTVGITYLFVGYVRLYTHSPEAEWSFLFFVLLGSVVWFLGAVSCCDRLNMLWKELYAPLPPLVSNKKNISPYY